MIAITDSSVARGEPTSHQNHAVETAARIHANVSPARGETAPVTSGLPCVRFITASMSRSRELLNAFAEPADRVPPIRVAIISHAPGQPSAASTMVGNVVMSSSSMMRGLVSDTYALSTRVAARILPTEGAGTSGGVVVVDGMARLYVGCAQTSARPCPPGPLRR